MNATATIAPRIQITHRPDLTQPAAPDAPIYLHFPADQVRMLMDIAGEHARPIEWIWDGVIALRIFGVQGAVVYANGCHPSVNPDALDTANKRMHGREHFSVRVPYLDFVRLFDLDENLRTVIVRLADDTFSLSGVNASGAVVVVKESPTDLLASAENLLVEILERSPAMPVEMKDRVEDYLRERHLLS